MDLLVEDWEEVFSLKIFRQNRRRSRPAFRKVLLETEYVELKANPKRLASGTVVRSIPRQR